MLGEITDPTVHSHLVMQPVVSERWSTNLKIAHVTRNAIDPFPYAACARSLKPLAFFQDRVEFPLYLGNASPLVCFCALTKSEVLSTI